MTWASVPSPGEAQHPFKAVQDGSGSKWREKFTASPPSAGPTHGKQVWQPEDAATDFAMGLRV